MDSLSSGLKAIEGLTKSKTASHHNTKTREEAQINGASGGRPAEPESGTSVFSLQDRTRELEKHGVKKGPS
ncbi:hypothetical protein RHMOL_Rhmol07G0242600 [Rhododendron molle]|uniref:Uncharacterized protein n=1 Tax=Rhododendron molle TaxID=49168 RepID=A0ACC0N463_RHOML|nr:hypothetical protein RHMOL_Rhmol07G0242600 [Rhododendron molle]